MQKIILTILVTGTLLFTATALAATYRMPKPGNDIVGKSFTIQVKKGDSLNSLSKRYGVSFHELLEANPNIEGNRLKVGSTLLVPTQFILPKYRKGIVINLPELRLYYFTPDGKYVKTYPLGLGRRDWRTPTGPTAVIKKKVNPDWNVPKSIKEHTLETRGKLLPDVIKGGTPENPLGFRALYLGKPGYLIHGTNNPGSIGKFVSSGCIRMYNQDVEELYPHVAIGTPVHILNISHKAGWYNERLYLQSSIPVNLPDQETSPFNNDSVDMAIREILGDGIADINWDMVDQVTAERTGVPIAIGGNS